MPYSINPFKLVQISLSFISAAEAAAAARNVSESSLTSPEKKGRLFESQSSLTEKEETGSLIHKSDKILKLLIGTKSILMQFRELSQEGFDILYPFTGLRNTYKSSKSPTRDDQLSNNFRKQVLERLDKRKNIVDDETQHNALDIYLKYSDIISTEKIVELDQSTISFLLNKRINQSIKKLDIFAARVSDPCLKILVVGDVKTRKQSLINSLIHHKILPLELQMERVLFCEILDVRDNSGEEEVHAIEDLEKYNRKDPTTYSIISLANLYSTISDCKKEIGCIKSLLHDEIVDIALIDCSNFLHDTIKITDAFMFVASSENYIVSSVEKLLSNNTFDENNNLFIVLNQFGNIADKVKCKQIVTNWIVESCPNIKRDVELFHFLPTKKISFNVANDLYQLRESLGNLATKKISKTKFVPAQDYLRSLIIDIGIVAEFNLYMATCESEKFERQLEEDKIAYEQLCKDLNETSSKSKKYARTTSNFVYKNTKDRTVNAIANMEQKSDINKIDFQGVLSTLSFANHVRDAMINGISEEISMCEKISKRQVDICISKINSLAEKLEGEFNEINLEEMYSGPALSSYIIQIFFLEFFYLKQSRDLNTNEDRSLTIAATSKILTMANLLGVTNFLGLPKTQRWVSRLLCIAGVGLFVKYILCNMRISIIRKIALKIRDHLNQTNFVDNEAERIKMQSDVKIDLSIEYLEKRIKQTLLAAQKRRLGILTAYKGTIESSEFFKLTFRRAEIIFESLNSICNVAEELEF
ncbi:7160_t:CDS:2 [Dentiscutata erythropus]|uniref:7160_t:CDS:1 n=1 Tax=Dentiscutata erythropus TaxID=1348616 RepID=A0A9N9IMA0_9GLOM|nr:7160_t:CDS:2 [Dentiscutata erythropus]